MADNKWNGLDAALARIRTLPDKLKVAGFKGAGVRAMRPVRDAARSKARAIDDQNTVANIAENIVTRTGSRRDQRKYGGDVIVTKVGVEGGAQTGKLLAFRNTKRNQKRGVAGYDYSVAHWRFLEFGTSKMKAQPFMLPALEENTDRVISEYSSGLSAAIDKAVKNAARAAARKAAK